MKSIRITQVRLQAGLSILWFCLFAPAVLWWKESVPFLVFVSVYANFVGHVSAWLAARAGRRIEEQTENGS
jgi:hypothetical protein